MTARSWWGVSTPSATIVWLRRRASSLQGSQHGLGGIVPGPGLHQREIDLHDVELELPQQPETRVAGPHVIGRDAHTVFAKHRDGAAEAVEILDGLALGELQHDPCRDRSRAGG